jgi:hypothetical protein
MFTDNLHPSLSEGSVFTAMGGTPAYPLKRGAADCILHPNIKDCSVSTAVEEDRMRNQLSAILAVTASLLFFNAGSGFSQEPTAAASLSEAEIQWLWGEVVSVDAQKGELGVKYLDYETDQEKQITVTVDSKTTYENAQALLDIKPQDTVSIDYVVGAEGKNIAKNINVEKPDAGPSMDITNATAIESPMNATPASAPVAPAQESQGTSGAAQ